MPMNRTKTLAMPPLDPEEALAQGLSAELLPPEELPAQLWPLDVEDLRISTQALALCGQAARRLLARQAAPAWGLELSPAKSVALFLDRIRWDPDGGCLYLCADWPGSSAWLCIPPAHWSVRLPDTLH